MKYVKSKIVILPHNNTPKKGDILLRHIWKNTKLEDRSIWQYNETVTIDNVEQYTTLNGSFRDTIDVFKPQHLYFLSDEEIKEGDYVIDETGLFGPVEREDVLINPKKIIATTDFLTRIEHDESVPYPKGIQHILPKPSNEFLKMYCELEGIDEVLVEYEEYTETKYSSNIDISIPAIKLKVAPDNTITIKPIESKLIQSQMKQKKILIKKLEEIERIIEDVQTYEENSEELQELAQAIAQYLTKTN